MSSVTRYSTSSGLSVPAAPLLVSGLFLIVLLYCTHTFHLRTTVKRFDCFSFTLTHPNYLSLYVLQCTLLSFAFFFRTMMLEVVVGRSHVLCCSRNRTKRKYKLLLGAISTVFLTTRQKPCLFGSCISFKIDSFIYLL